MYDILAHPSGPERHEALAEYKTKLRDQLEALAHVQEMMVERIEVKPDISRDELQRIAVEFRNQYGFSDSQMQQINELIDRFIEHHNTITAVRQRYPDDRELLKAVFGFEPTGSVDIIEGPLTLDIVCYNVEGFAQILLDQEDRTSLTDDDMALVQKSGAANLTRSLRSMPELTGKIVVVNGERLSYDEDLDAWLVHEHQHALNAFLLPLILRLDGLPSWHEMETANGSKEVAAAARNFLKESGKVVMGLAGDEILALYRERPGDRQFIARTMMTDYWGEYHRVVRRSLMDWPSHNRHAPISALKEIFDEMIELEFKTRMERMVENGVKSIQTLEMANWSAERITSFLSSRPIESWPQAVKLATFDELKPSPLERKRVSHSPIERAEDV